MNMSDVDWFEQRVFLNGCSRKHSYGGLNFVSVVSCRNDNYSPMPLVHKSAIAVALAS
jgi:hypothetical protein